MPGSLLLLLVLAGPALAGETVLEGKHVVLKSTVAHDAANAKCRDVLEGALAVYAKHLPGYALPAEKKLVLHLYATKEEYAAAIKTVGGEKFVDNEAFTSSATHESYVVLQPRSDAAYLDVVGLPELTAYLVCHEGVHQWLRLCGAPNVDRWPFWYAEGMAEFLSEQCLRAGDPKALIMPLEDSRQELQEALASGKMPSVVRVLHSNGQGKTWTLYGASYCLYRFLARDTARLQAFHDAVAKLPAPDGDFPRYAHARACARAFAQVFGPLEEVDRKWREAVKAEPARWFEHERTTQLLGAETVCAASGNDDDATLISGQRAPANGFVLQCEVQILDLEKKQADIYLAFERRDDPRFLKVALGADGYATLLGFSDGAWQDQLRKNATLEKDAIKPGEWVSVTVTVAKGSIKVSLDGKERLEAEFPPGFEASGRWGVGAHSGVVRYRKLSVAPAK